MLKQLKQLLSKKKEEFSQNAHGCATNDFEEVEQDAKGLELHKIITELENLIKEVEGSIEIDINDYDGKPLKMNSIIQMVDEDGEAYDDKTSTVRMVIDDNNYSIRAFEANHAYVAISNDEYARDFRIVEVV